MSTQQKTPLPAATNTNPDPEPDPFLNATFTQSSRQTIYDTLTALKKSTLTIHNRLTSILHDSTFITHLSTTIFPDLPVIANERAGSWYIPPSLHPKSAYFKSTDGHYNQWRFSTRRLNLQVLEILGSKGGAVVVDSTRRGKVMSDALRRTVPIWVVVWNRVLFGGGEYSQKRVEVMGWRFVGGDGMEEREESRIEERVEGWIEEVKGLGLDLDGLRRKVKRPMRCVWVVNGESDLDEVKRQVVQSREEGWNVLVLCSASRRVLGAEMSADGYVQGAGDDSEGWSHGLTSRIFWKHSDDLLQSTEEELPSLIENLVKDVKTGEGFQNAVLIEPTSSLFLAAGRTQPGYDVPNEYSMLIGCNGTEYNETKTVLQLGCRTGKLGSRDLREKLVIAKEFVSKAFAQDRDCKILVICESGKDLSVGVLIMLLCFFSDNEGKLTTNIPQHTMSKQLVKQRLAWITSSNPDANPSRSTLQAVNSFLMDRPS